MPSERIPHVTPQLIQHLRDGRREWQNILPDQDWTMDQVQRAIGANEVISHLEELLARQMGVISDLD